MPPSPNDPTTQRPILATAPGRCGVIGNPSDMYGGCVISCSTPVRNRCTIEPADHWQLPEDTRLWAALVHASGGVWGGCVYDVDKIIEKLEKHA